MCAVNDPFVVLGAASSKFIAPVKVGEAILSKATVSSGQGKKSVVSVTSLVGNRVVFEGSFTTFVLESHVLD
jgi:predicted thioesterase